MVISMLCEQKHRGEDGIFGAIWSILVSIVVGRSPGYSTVYILLYNII